ncbi:MAG: trypsin-like peptidase domain-containing protein [Bacillota bacterium]|nr:trypsin-like peptidase domain-containing protein [Bacillota bacterium]
MSIKRKPVFIAVSICLSALLAVGCIISIIFINKHYEDREITSPSKLSALNSGTGAQKDNTNPTRKEIITQCQKQVFYLEIKEENISGSGFLYDNYGDIVTNAHVVGNSSTVTVRLPDSKTEYTGLVVGKGTDLDVALVRVPELAGIQPLKIAKEKKAQLGDEVIALGSPLGYQNTVTTGIISGLDRSFDIENYTYNKIYQISAPISPGSSGGPLIDSLTGDVLGINSAYIQEGNMGFSIPIYQCVDSLDKWADNPQVANVGGKGLFSGKLSGKDLTDNAIELVKYLYGCINTKDYATAYLLWGYESRSVTDYDRFKTGYLNTTNVQVLSSTASLNKDGTIKVDITISAEESTDQGTSSKTGYKVSYTVGYENGVLKILDGSAQKI